MAKVISICNRKGGVGKTATAVNLGAYLAALGKYVLLVDIDPQANATLGLGIDPENLQKSVYHSLIDGVYPRDIIKKTRIFGFDILPSSFDLAGATVELVNFKNREFVLFNVLDKIRLDYDYILIDSPPSLELLTLNALVAADEVIVPVQCEYYSFKGLNQLLGAIKLIQENLRPELKLGGVLLTMYDKKFSKHLFRTIIPRDDKLAIAPKLRKTILQYDHRSKGAKAYLKLAKEIISFEP